VALNLDGCLIARGGQDEQHWHVYRRRNFEEKINLLPFSSLFDTIFAVDFLMESSTYPS
jgi:hypothetical protein